MAKSKGSGDNSRVRVQPEPKRRSKPPAKIVDSSPAGSLERVGHPRPAILGDDFSESAFERHAALLGDSRMSHPMYAGERAGIVQQLQRDYGNRYVQRLVKHISRKRAEAVQAKLTVGPAGDKYEQEADQVAKQVMGTISSPGQEAAQRQSPEEEELQMKPLAQRQPMDEEEEMLQAKPVAQRQEEEEELQMMPQAQRQGEEEELQMKPMAQRQIPLEGGDVDREVENTIQQAKGGGQALPDNVRTPMEGAFGADFSGVRVHSDAQADALNSSMRARAFTTGKDIFIRSGEYKPGSSSGQELLAHELTHVVQQNGVADAKKSEDAEHVERDTGSGVVQLQAVTPLGAKAAMMGAPEKAQLADRLMNEDESVTKYATGVCYDTVAFVKYLLGSNISSDQILDVTGGAWLPIFDFENGTLWQGGNIPPGTAVGFRRPPGSGTVEPSGFFHAALSVGGTTVRAVNGMRLGAGWNIAPSDLAAIRGLTERDVGEDGEHPTYNYKLDGAPLQVWLSNL